MSNRVTADMTPAEAAAVATEAGLRSITAADPSETQLEAYVHWVHDTVRGLLQSAGTGET